MQVFYLKKIIILLLILTLLPFGVYAATRPAYPVIPDRLLQISKAMLQIDDTNATLLYERIPITEDYGAWMVGWFWDEHKIVVGITDEGEIIYYNTAPLGFVTTYPTGTTITKEEGYEIVLDFLKIIMQGRQWKLKSAGAYEYEFSETHNGIPIFGHDATVVVDKSSGKVIYYKGFSTYASSYEIIKKMISKSYAYNLYFENVGLELVYQTKYDDATKSKYIKPVYIFNNKNNNVIDVADGSVDTIKMYDYNVYYTETFFDERFDFDNNIKTDEAIFVADNSIESNAKIIPEENVRNAFCSIASGYAFKSNKGVLKYYKTASSENAVPVWQVNIVPSVFKDGIDRFSTMYDIGEIDWLKSTETKKQFCFARAYVNAMTGEILEFKSIINDKYPGGNTYTRDVAIKRFLPIATGQHFDSLKMYGENKINSYISEYGYARYENDMRVIGEGAVFTYNNKIGDITDYTLNISGEIMPLYGAKTQTEMKELIREEVPFEIIYIDKNKNEKYPVYSFKNIMAEFDPVTGNYVNRTSGNEINTIFIFEQASKLYSVNGVEKYASAPVIHNEKLFLPIRFISNELGYVISWNDDNTITIESHKEIIYISPDGNCSINNINFQLFEKPFIIEGITYVSLKDICRIFGMQSSWEAKTNSIYILN